MDTLARIKDLAVKELSLDPGKIDSNAPLADLDLRLDCGDHRPITATSWMRRSPVHP